MIAPRVSWPLTAFALLLGCGSSEPGSSPVSGSPRELAATSDGGSNAVDAPKTDGGVAVALPKIPLGEPIAAPDGVWTRVAFPDGRCRDGTAAHLMVRRNSQSKKFAIYLEGGGGCFNDATCLININAPTYIFGGGIFNFGNPNNPIGDWNVFYVPYCTGDGHVGAAEAGVPGPKTGPQKFSGYANLQLYLSRILATMPDATDELLTGISSGGFGASLAAGLVARNMPDSVERFTMLDDSGPALPASGMPPCLLDIWRNVWGLENTFLKECGSACPAHDNYVYDWVRYLLDTYSKGPRQRRFMAGLLSWSTDATMRKFLGYGANDCSVSSPETLSATDFTDGLLAFRKMLQDTPTSAFGTYYAPGGSHTFLAVDGLYYTRAGDVNLVDWIKALLAHEPATHVGP